MATTFLKDVIPHVANALQPLSESFETQDKLEGFLKQFGWHTTGTIPPAYLNLATNAKTIINGAVSAYEAESLDETTVQAILQAVSSLFTNLNGIGSAPPGVDASDFLATFPEELVDYLVYSYLKKYQNKIYSFLVFLDVVKFEAVSASGSRLAYVKTRIDYDAILDILANPVDKLKQVFKWGVSSYSSKKLLDALYRWASPRFLTLRSSGLDIETEAGLQTSYGSTLRFNSLVRILLFSVPVNQQIQNLFIDFVGVDSVAANEAGIVAILNLPQQLNFEYDVADDKKLTVSAATSLSTQIAFGISSQGVILKYPFQNVGSTPPFGLTISLDYTPNKPYLLLGTTDGSRLVLSDSSVVFNVGSNEDLEISFEIDLSGLHLIVDAKNSDGFLKNLLGDTAKDISAPVTLVWSSKSGFGIKGSGSLEYSVPAHIRIGSVVFDTIKLALIPNPATNTVRFTAQTDISGKVGPLSFLVGGFGIGAGLKFEDGNLGPFDLKIGIKPPTGVGISIDSGTVEGSGFLSLDSERGIYSGSFKLTFSKFKLNAVGILNTKLPNGAPGYSLLILITAEFNPIQLGLGFTLNGVGGMLGLHRTLDADALQNALRSGGLENILFPQNVNDEASSIISTLNTLFPISEGRFLIAPMAKIGWGTLPGNDASSLLTIDLGILLELPNPVRLAVVGVLRCVLPSKENPLLVLNCAFAGIIDFDRQYVRFDARIYDSRIKNLTLSGMMALRIFWGRQKEMLISVGGFHPAYTPPVLLNLPRVMERMAISLDEGSLQMRLEAYYALTSNTVQLGASLRLEYRFYSFKAEGHLGFDALFQFNPFYFNVRIQAGVSISWSGNELMGVQIDFMLEGPKPWHAKGYAEFSVAGCSKKLQLDKTWGEQRSPEPRPVITLRPQLAAAFADKANWQTITPGAGDLLVSLRKWNDDLLVIHPNGRLQISQKIAPLDIALTRYGQAALSDPGRYRIDYLTIANVAQQITSIKEAFSPAQYLDMDDDDKLKAPSFEYLTAGVEAKSTADWQADYYVIKEMGYDEVIKDKVRRPRNTGGSGSTGIALDTSLAAAFVSGGLIGQNQVGGARLAQLNNAISGVQMAAPAYQVTDRDQLLETSTAVGVPLTFESEAEARDYQQALGILATFTKVIPSYYNA